MARTSNPNIQYEVSAEAMKWLNRRPAAPLHKSRQKTLGEMEKEEFNNSIKRYEDNATPEEKARAEFLKANPGARKVTGSLARKRLQKQREEEERRLKMNIEDKTLTEEKKKA